MDFLDDPNCPLVCTLCTQGTADPAELRRLTRGLLVAFYEQTLRGDGRWAAWLAAPATGALDVVVAAK